MQSAYATSTRSVQEFVIYLRLCLELLLCLRSLPFIGDTPTAVLAAVCFAVLAARSIYLCMFIKSVPQLSS